MTTVSRNLNRVVIHRLDKPEVTFDFISTIFKGTQAGFTDFELDFQLEERPVIYPNAACPLAGYLDFYKKQGLNFNRIDKNQAVSTSKIMAPLFLSEPHAERQKNVLNAVWRFESSDDVFDLTTSIIDELSRIDRFKSGALQSLEWSLNEIMDNVIQHAKTEAGFVMGQIHKRTKHVAFCIFDNGQGIFNSLKTAINPPRTALDALTLCIKEGVTRDKKVGQGNGMFGLYQVVLQNEGQLVITSSGASISLKKQGELDTSNNLTFPSKDFGCTSVDFQLDYKKPISLSNALNINGKNYKTTNYRLENLENEQGEMIFKVKEKSSGFGTRQAGLRARNEVLNIYSESKQVIVIDFDGINLISSSFADEFIGKLVVEFGFFGFNNVIRLRNMNEITQSIVQRSVSQRMAESLEN